jgi:GMP synthase-like glutamine amidotransferase
MRILVIQHESDAPPALFGDWAAERGHVLVVRSAAVMDHSWPPPAEFDAVVSLGSEESVHASPPGWMRYELDLLSRAHHDDVPVLGICFGGQALAKALGGEVKRTPATRVLWGEAESSGPDLVLPGPWFWWHSDRFGLPPGAKLLAGTPTNPAAFAAGRSLGVQFHPEVDGELVRHWLDAGQDRLAELGVDADELERETTELAAGARARAFAQFDRVAAWWADRAEQT